VRMCNSVHCSHDLARLLKWGGSSVPVLGTAAHQTRARKQVTQCTNDCFQKRSTNEVICTLALTVLNALPMISFLLEK
jgi:hypothetical protein